MPNDFQTGAGTKIRFKVLAAGTRTRPSALADFTTLAQVTTSDLSLTASDVTTTTYDSDKKEDGKVTKTAWGFNATANVPATLLNRTAINALRDAANAGDEVWIERQLAGETTWEGGVASIMSFASPAPADGIVTVTCQFKGRGAYSDNLAEVS